MERRGERSRTRLRVLYGDLEVVGVLETDLGGAAQFWERYRDYIGTC
jgi:hypothetical protein